MQQHRSYSTLVKTTILMIFPSLYSKKIKLYAPQTTKLLFSQFKPRQQTENQNKGKVLNLSQCLKVLRLFLIFVQETCPIKTIPFLPSSCPTSSTVTTFHQKGNSSQNGARCRTPQRECYFMNIYYTYVLKKIQFWSKIKQQRFLAMVT